MNHTSIFYSATTCSVQKSEREYRATGGRTHDESGFFRAMWPPLSISGITTCRHHRSRPRHTAAAATSMSLTSLGYPNGSQVARKDDALPHELVVSIQRVLDLHPGPDADPLDDLTDEFGPVGVLNQFFPDGTPPCTPPVVQILSMSVQRRLSVNSRPCRLSSRRARRSFSMR